MAHYGSLRPSALIVTKTDESSTCDGLTTLFELAGKPVVYVTDGQRVPEDIHAASPGILASIVMPDVASGEPVKIGGGLNGGNFP
jgi:flagellar biosynthesis protein FlhF